MNSNNDFEGSFASFLSFTIINIGGIIIKFNNLEKINFN